MVIDKIGKADLLEYLELCNSVAPTNIKALHAVAVDSIAFYRDSTANRDLIRHQRKLEQRWYKSLKTQPDYSVYSSTYYLADLWACWVVYSRKYIKQLATLKLRGITTVLDLGCGFGYTTAALKELFPSALVIGTNIAGTDQYKIAAAVGRRYNFTVCERLLEHADLVFASEYFEHIDNPIEHLESIVERNTPTYFVIANSFNTQSIGHFTRYYHNGNYIDQSQISRAFNKRLAELGYVKVITDFWNNRPAVYKRVVK